jgi:peptide chain release factor 1
MFAEAGGHRIQRVPPTERNGRVHTSTVTVAVIDSSAPAQEFSLNENDLRIEWYSGSGAGGQHRNKHQNSCRITHLPTGLMRKAETRKRESSQREAVEALREALAAKHCGAALSEQNGLRKRQVGSGMRGDKRRTYRFQENSVTDHVTGKSARCADVMAGAFDLLW